MGCRDKVQAVAFAPRSKQLLSAGDDRVVAYWNMDIKRLEVGPQLGVGGGSTTGDGRWVHNWGWEVGPQLGGGGDGPTTGGWEVGPQVGVVGGSTTGGGRWVHNWGWEVGPQLGVGGGSTTGGGRWVHKWGW